MFERCEFLVEKEGRDILIAIPSVLPISETYTVSVSPKTIRFIAGHKKVTEFPYHSKEVFHRLSFKREVGLIESRDGGENYPEYLTNVAYIEVRKEEAA